MSQTPRSFLDRFGDPADAGAWRELVELYTPLIRGWLRSRGLQPCDVDDLAQEVLGAIVRGLPRFRHNGRPGAFRRWLRTITTNAVLGHLRATRRRAEAVGGSDFARVLGQLADPDSAPGRAWEREHDRHVAGRLLARVEQEVRPATWRAFRRSVIDDVAADAVAAELGLSINAVLIARSRVLRRLRQLGAGLLD